MWCPSCASEYRAGFAECPDCREPLATAPPRTPAPVDHDQVEYDVSGWSDEQRESLRFWLLVSQVPAEWRGSWIVVPAVHEADADRILDAIEDGDHPDSAAATVDLAGAEAGDDAPATGAPQLAGPGRRLVGFLIDAAILGIPRMIVFTYVADSAFVTGLLLMLDALYHVGLTARSGRTVGKAVVDTEVVRIDGVRPPGLSVAAVRYAVVVAALPLAWFFGEVGSWISLVWSVAVYLPVLGRERRGIHDRIAGTDVFLRSR